MTNAYRPEIWPVNQIFSEGKITVSIPFETLYDDEVSIIDVPIKLTVKGMGV